MTQKQFYNGQKSTVIQELNALGVLNDVRPFNVFTVDSYQGEENDIILLSLVRSNRDLSIGFLDSKNRLVVALSRARRGLYVFGNAATLGPAETNEDLGHQGREPLWYPLIKEMTSQCRLDMDGGLPVTCSRHGKVTRLYEPKHFDQVFAGGCDQMCVGAILPCGHPCKSACHPLDHTKVRCKQACMRTLTCGHKCSNVCTDKCYCVACGLYDGQVRVPDYADENVDLYGNIGHSVWQDSPPKNSKERSTPQQLAGKPVSLVPASTSTFNGSDTRFDLPHGGQSFGQVSPMRSFSGPLMASSGNRISPSKGGDLHLSTPSKPRPGTIGSCGSEISSQATVIRRPAFGASNFSPEAWQNWDAKKADEELAEKRRREEAAAPKADRSTLVFNETFIPTTFNNSGERVFVSSGSRRRVVPRSNVVSRGNIASLNAVLADSPFPRHDVDLGFQKKDQKPCENSRPHPISPTEISQAAQKKVAAASRALINVTSDFPSLAMKQTMLPAFGEDSEYTERFAEVNRSLNSMQERPNARGRDERFVSGSSSRGLTTPRGGSFRGGDLPHGYTAPRGGNFGEENSYRGRGSFRGYRPSRRGAPFRGKDSSRGVASSRGRGYVRGGSARGECHSRGGRSQSQQALPQAIGDLVGLEDDFSHTSLHEASDVVEDIVNLYGTSPLQS